jgi:hypothetical protein
MDIVFRENFHRLGLTFHDFIFLCIQKWDMLVSISVTDITGTSHLQVDLLRYKKLIMWFSGPCVSIQMLMHGQFYCHFHKITIPHAELHYFGKKIVMGSNFR